MHTLGSERTAPAVPARRPPLEPASRLAQALVLIALLAGAAYLTWRWGFTLDGAATWLALPLVVAETYAVAMLGMLALSAWRLARRPTPPPLQGQTVAVLVATFDEDPDVLRPTVVGALAIRNDPRPEVWVLDDGARDWVREMCDELGARYLSRPPPRRHAKAGNINHALERVEARFLVTLDADHVPRPELLERMLGHFADPSVAVVQAPQAFYNRGFGHPRSEDDPLRNEQSIFFDVVCRGKDRNGAAFWCGCPSVIRRAALERVGGVAVDTVVEDAHTSMRLHAAGWRTVYHDEVMALGLAPEEIGAFVVQRARWARGSLQMLRLDPPLLRRGLTWRQRLEYTASCLHFLEGPQRLVALLVPGAVLATGALPLATDPLLYAAVFVPPAVLTPLASIAMTRGRYRVLEGERYSIVRMEAYLRALAALPRGRGGGFRVTPKGARAGGSPVARAMAVPLAVAGVTLAAVGYQTAAQLLDLPGRLPAAASTVTTLWAFLNVGLIAYTYAWARGVQHRRRSHRFPVAMHAAYSGDDGGPAIDSRVTDLSRHGARLVVREPREPGERLRLVLLLDDGPVEVTGVIATVTAGVPGEGWTIGLDFDPVDAATADAIVRWCFRHPFGLERPVGPPPPPVAAPADPAPYFASMLAAAQTAATEAPGERGRGPAGG
ncbi:glycosyltransferase [Miltoncostaea marina]|uniref:glycosyltransferase n=1 Tax=Miltoncostaea marina TaxID=2843215 RepID=UPI001C3DAFC4|nr:glycosyltransferase [Miltoncostaea marina]